MKNNNIELYVNKNNMIEFSGRMLEIVLDKIEFEPVYRNIKINEKGDQIENEPFLDENADIIYGKLISIEKTHDSSEDEVNVCKEFYITESGKCLVFYTEHEKAFGEVTEEGEHITNRRYFPSDQSLSDDVKFDFIRELLMDYFWKSR